MVNLLANCKKIIKHLPQYWQMRIIYRHHTVLHPIYIFDNIFFRWLNFGNSATQSKVFKLQKSLPIQTSVKILSLAGEVFNHNYLSLNLQNTQKPIRIIIFGLGGGDLVRYYYENLNKLTKKFELTVIERSPEILQVATQFFYLKKFIKKINIIIDDAFDYILNKMHHSKQFDIVTLDLFIELDSTTQTLEEKYINKIFNQLNSHHGIVAFNVLVSDSEKLNNFITLLKSKTNHILVTSNISHYNVIIFAFMNEQHINYLQDNEQNKNYFKDYFNNIIYSKQHGYHIAQFNNQENQ